MHYAWEKAHEAIRALTSDLSMEQRLTDAARSLSDFPLKGLPVDTVKLALVADRAFTSIPELPEYSHAEGACSTLIRLLPETRKQVLIDKVIGLFQAICELRGSAVPEYSSAMPTPDFALDSPDKWEFLFWNIGDNASEQVRAQYVRFAHHWLPNFPAEVLLEWLGRHGYDGMRHWTHLPLERLQFEDVVWTYDELCEIQAMDSRFTEVGPQSIGAHQLTRKGDWIGEYIDEHGTWSAPIIVLDHATPAQKAGYVVPAGLVLVEGHCRLSRLLNLPSEKRYEQRHRVMIGTVTPNVA